jgi:hypothetical protein
MKTFAEFVFEAAGDVAKEIATLRAKANAERQKGDMKTFIELQHQAAELGAGTQAKISAETDDKPKQKPRENTWVSGKPSKDRDTRARGGSLANIPSSDGEGEGSIVSGKQGDTRTGRSGGVRSTLMNRGTARTGRTLGVKGRS